MDIYEDPKIDAPPVVAPPVGSPTSSPLPLSEASSIFDTPVAATADRALWIPPTLRKFQRERDHVRELTRGMKTHMTKIATAQPWIDRVRRRMDSLEVFSICKAFEGNTRDLVSFEEEMDKTTDLHQHLSRISPLRLETESQNTRDAITNPTTTMDLATTSECSRPKETLEHSASRD
nr:hypothetical protein [Tanacetum cinerariifolium]